MHLTEDGVVRSPRSRKVNKLGSYNTVRKLSESGVGLSTVAELMSSGKALACGFRETTVSTAIQLNQFCRIR